ncbi:MAG: hypothetical protein ABIK21_01180 [bacterium]
MEKKERRSGKERRSEKDRRRYNDPNYKLTSFYLSLSNVFMY